MDTSHWFGLYSAFFRWAAAIMGYRGSIGNGGHFDANIVDAPDGGFTACARSLYINIRCPDPCFMGEGSGMGGGFLIDGDIYRGQAGAHPG